MKLLVVVSIISSVLLQFTSAVHVTFPTNESCDVGRCKNPCEAKGQTCCFCDETTNIDFDACFCCPKNYSCCPSETWAGSTTAHCCPDGYKCTSNGRCTASLVAKPEYTHGVCGFNCRKATKFYVTADDTFKLYMDGERKSLENGDNWVEHDIIDILSTTKVITICAENIQYKAGILAYTLDPSVLEYAEWKCINSIEKCAEWSHPEFDASHWGSSYIDEKNDGKGTRRDKFVEGIPKETYWRWCNNPNSKDTKDWIPKCTCRITLKNKSGY